MTPGERQQEFIIGVMKTSVEDADSNSFDSLVEVAVDQFQAALDDSLNLRVEVFEFPGPHLSPAEGAYEPLDFLQLGLAEKLERNINFLLVITEVDLAASTRSYVLALPSRLANVGIISTKRLSPEFWGRPKDLELTTRRLRNLLLHTLGHILNLGHSDDPHNVMYDFGVVDRLEEMDGVTAEQVEQMRRNLPVEAHEAVSRSGGWGFVMRQIAENWRSIGRTLLRANPFRLMLQLPRMLTAVLSVLIVLFFTAEIWDVGSSLTGAQMLLISLVGIFGSTAALYRAFHLSIEQGRSNTVTASTIVITTATLLTLFLTILLIYLLTFAVSLVSALTLFPEQLKETWPTVDPAIRLSEQIRLSMFLAGIGVLAGSLGGSADAEPLVRRVLFIDEET
ncbi:MAG: hypothetical protein R3272_13215 [Candidatus Promineifilaceae bacterium]|nr:hypothetical protein [Candidatus Promineifilaceae bacterium]